MAETGTPGVVVGVLRKGRAYAQGFGVTNLNAPAPVDTETLFQIGSTTKTFTASAAMRLVEQGRLDLDVPVKRYLKDLRLRDQAAESRVTLRHLFTHTAGWVGDYFEDTGSGDDALTKILGSMRRVPQITPLGEVWHYNNAGFYVAGRILEKVYGQPFHIALKELLLAPLGMTRSFLLPEEAIMHRVAVGHIEARKKQTVAPTWWLNRSMSPAGGLISDVIDQLRWAWFSLGDGRAPDGKRLLKKSTMKSMQREHAPAGSAADAVGISWLIEEIDGVRVIFHGGTTPGQLSQFVLVPSEQVAVTVMSNSTSGRSLNRAVVGWVLEHYAELARPTLEPLSGADLSGYEGRYVDGLKINTIDIKPSGRRLVGLLTSADGVRLGPFRLALYDEDRAVQLDGYLNGMKGEFLRDAKGRVTWFRYGGRLYRRTRTASKSTGKPKKVKSRAGSR